MLKRMQYVLVSYMIMCKLVVDAQVMVRDRARGGRVIDELNHNMRMFPMRFVADERVATSLLIFMTNSNQFTAILNTYTGLARTRTVGDFELDDSENEDTVHDYRKSMHRRDLQVDANMHTTNTLLNNSREMRLLVNRDDSTSMDNQPDRQAHTPTRTETCESESVLFRLSREMPPTRNVCLLSSRIY